MNLNNLDNIKEIIKNPKENIVPLIILFFLFIVMIWLGVFISEKAKQAADPENTPIKLENKNINQTSTAPNATQIATSGNNSPVTNIGEQKIYLINKENSSIQRPYLIPKLIANPPCFTIDGQSVMTFTLMDKKFLCMRFILNNTESIPALNVRGKYDSPTQKNVNFDMAENVILPNSFSQRLWTPWVNIQSVVNEQNNDPFDVTVTIEYDGKNGVDSQKYLSFLKLKIKKVSNDKYRLIDEEVTFGIKEK